MTNWKSRVLRSSRKILTAVVITALLTGTSPANAQSNTPDAPDRPIGTVVFTGGVDLEWNDVPGADSYDVQLFRDGLWMELPSDGVEVAFYGAGAVISGLDPGSTLWFQVRARNSHGSSAWSEFSQLGSTSQSLLGRRARPANTPASGALGITGTTQVDETLSADTTGIADENGLDRVEFGFQWVSNSGSVDTDIAGATSRTYTLTVDDRGKTIKVRTSFTDRGGYAESLTSAATAEIEASTNQPATGAPDVAVANGTDPPPALQSATVNRSELDLYFDKPVHYGFYSQGGYSPAPEAFAVMVNGTAREVSRALVARQAASGWRFRVNLRLASGVTAGDTVTVGYTIPTGANAYPLLGSQHPVASFAGETVTNETTLLANAAPTGRVTISGTAQVGETLTPLSLIADADGLTQVVYRYQWVRDDGTGESDITGATSYTYTLVDADQGNTVKVRVSFTDDANNGETMYSAATDEVAAAPPPTPPTASDTAFVVGDDMSFGFSEKLDPTSVPEPAAFTVTVNGVPRDVARLAHRSFSMGLRLTSPVTSGDTVTLAYTVPTGADAKPLRSFESGLLLASFAGLSAKNSTPPPVLTSATVDRTSITLDFNLRLRIDMPEPTAFAVMVNGTAREVSGVSRNTHGYNVERRVFLGLASTVRYGDTVTVAYTVPTGPDANPLRGMLWDLAVASFESVAVTNETDPPPTLQLATVDGDELHLFFDLSVSSGLFFGGGPPAREAFTVMVNGTAREVSSLYLAWSRTALEPGWRVSLRLASAVTAGDTVTVGYTVPTGADAHPLMGSQHPVASFAGEAVTNETAPPAGNVVSTGRLLISGTAQVGETLTADVSGIADADGLTQVVFRYQWVRDDGTGESDIAGATSSTYTLVDADQGNTVKARVSFTDDANNGQTKYSAATDEVAAAVQGGPVWSASITVGEDSSTLPASLGFSTYSRLGSLSERDFTAGGVRNRVHVLAERTDGLYLVLSQELASDFRLVIGDQEFLAGDSSEPPSGAGNGRYWWQTSGLGWSAGDVLDVSIELVDGDVADRPMSPPTAYVKDAPIGHDGSTTFSFRLFFSENVPLSFRTLKHHAIEVTNGTVKSMKRVEKGSNSEWRVTVKPDSDSEIVVTVLATADCAANSAICAEDGRKLHNSVEFTVWGPSNTDAGYLPRAVPGWDN